MKKLIDLLSRRESSSSDLTPLGWRTIQPVRSGDPVRDYNETWEHMRRNGLGYTGYNYVKR